MGKCLFLHPNRADGGTYSGGSWETSLPLTNLKDQRVSKVARSTAATTAATKFDIDLGATRYLAGIALVGHNISLAGQVRFQVDDAADFATPVYNSGWVDAIPDIYPSNMPQWEVPASRDGALKAEDYAAGYVPDVQHLFSSLQTGRYIRVEIDDTTNSDGYVQIGRCVVGSGFEPTINFEVGASLGWQTSTTILESPGGALHFDEMPRRRVFNFTLPEADNDEALVHTFEIHRALGMHSQLYFIYDQTDSVHMHRRSFLATLGRMHPMNIPNGVRVDQAFSLIEAL